MKCVQCGSDRIIPNVKVLVGDMLRTLEVQVLEKPESTYLKRPKYFKTYAKACGGCGKIDIYVENPNDMWESYQKSLESLE